MSVKRLSSEITSKLRSGVAINNIPQCVEELVLNSLDAGANCIAVRLDLTFFKIRVIDNGRGIRFSDLDLVGSRYATSKCNTLEDLYTTKTFGHRGEALSSIRDVSQEMTITTRSADVQSSNTYIKSFRGSSSSIDRAQLQRPSNGTTVTVINFLYNLPVRQGTVRETLNVEGVRRNLEILALAHPQVSFSLYNDTTDSYCLRVSKSSSVTSTFGQLYGGSWAPLLKVVVGCRDPFVIEGVVATKGHHNRRLQFVYVHRRRIADERLHKTINEIFEKSFEDGGLRFTLFPVYVLFVDCPRKNYDLGLCPSKTLVQFRHFDVLKELLVQVVKTFLSEHASDDRFSGLASPSKPVAEKLQPRPPNETKILVHDYRHSLHSLAAKRPHPTKNENDEGCITPKSFSNVPNEPPKRPREQSPLQIFKNVPKLSSSSLDGLIPTLYLSEKPKVNDVKYPICMSPAVASHTTILGRLTKEKDRKERTRKAVEDLQRFSYQTLQKIAIAKDSSASSHQEIRDLDSNSRILNKYVTPSNNETIYSKHQSSELIYDQLQRSYEQTETQMLSSPVIQPSLRLHPQMQKEEAEISKASTVSADPMTKNVDVSSRVESSSESAARNWIIGLHPDDDGQFYLDPTSGNSYFGMPRTRELQSNSATIVSSSCLTLDAVLGEENYHATSNLPSRPWRSKETEVDQQKAGDDRPLAHFPLSSLFDNWDNPILGKGDEQESLSKVITMSRLPIPVDSFSAVGSQSYTFSRNIFDDLQFVNQLDRKFLICLATYADIPQLADGSLKSHLLVLFDQHAVHERIRLESFLYGSLSIPRSHEDWVYSIISFVDAGFNNDSEGLVASTVDPPMSLTLPTEDVRMASSYKLHLAKCGVCVSVDDEEESRLTIHSLPSCFIERDVSECKQQRASVLNVLAEKLILEITENLRHGLPVRPTIPKVVLNVLKSQACHGALKFGHRLTPKTCKHLMTKLGKCKLPFQCAHGRPSITALVDLRHVPKSKKVSKPNLQKLNLMMSKSTNEL